MRTIEWKDGIVLTVDQLRLPHDFVLLELRSASEIADAIRSMKVRGAPLIGAAAAYGLALTAYYSKTKSKEDLLYELEVSAKALRETRPTAVNLSWAIDRVLNMVKATVGGVDAVAKAVILEAQRIADEDAEMNYAMGRFGADLITDGDVILTHCNAGAFATVDYGTALGVIKTAWSQGKKIKVFATETRPQLQGARLTTYELQRDGIPVTLITDNMVGFLMYRRMITKVIVGSDRIVRDAVINKIGTYGIAVLAHEHHIPFYAAAPSSTFDLTHSAKEVVIEERSPDEVTCFSSQRIAPIGINAFNPAFDITPFKYVSAIICEKGVFSPTGFKKLLHIS